MFDVSSSGLIYAAIVGAWAAYLVPMWLRRQDELNEARHTERFTTAIRILSRRGAMERRYARMIANGDEGLATAAVEIPTRDRQRPSGPGQSPDAHARENPARDAQSRDSQSRDNHSRDGQARDAQSRDGHSRDRQSAREYQAREYQGHENQGRDKPPPATPPEQVDSAPRRRDVPAAQAPRARQVHAPVDETGRPGASAGAFERSRGGSPAAARTPQSPANPAQPAPQTPAHPAAAESDAESAEGVRRRFGLGRRTPAPVAVKPPAPLKGPDGRAKLLARRRRVVVCLFLLFTAGAVVTGMIGLAWIWLPVLPGIALTGYIAYLRIQERRRYETNLRNQLRPTPSARPAPPRPARKAEGEPRRAAAPQPDPPARRRPAEGSATPPRGGQSRTATPPASHEPRPRSGRRAADERDHAEWIAALQADGADGTDRDSWDPVPVPLPTYVTAPVVPRGEPVLPERPEPATPEPVAADPTPLFDQYAEDPRRAPQYPPYEQDWPRAGNE